MTTSSDDDWMNEIADHLEAIIRILRRRRGDDDHAQDLPPSAVPEDDPIALARRVHPLLGDAQAPVLRKVAEAHPEGISAGDVARALGLQPTSAYLILASLVRQRLVRKDEDSSPHRYYLGTRMLMAAS